MDIALIGGSNTGISYGWARQFEREAKRHVVANRFLGAVGSLFGLLRLMELERGGALPELVVFEYSLNDMMLLDSGCVTPDQLRDTLVDVIAFCASRRLPLVFLCLEVQPIGRQRVHACVTVVKTLYVEVARDHGVRCLTLDEIIGPPRREDFADEHHLSETVSKQVVDRLLLEIALGRVTVPEPPPSRPPAFFYRRAAEAQMLGPCRRIDIASTVFSGEFLEIGRGGAARWPGGGELVGVMLRSTQTAGAFAISAGRRKLRKNAQSGMRAAAPRLMLLHYLTKPLPCADDLEVSMPESEAELMRLREDRTPLSTAPETPFDAQLLEIHGAMFWRPPPR